MDKLILAESDYARLRRLSVPAPLARELARAKVVSDDELAPDVVRLGARVLYTDETERTRRLVCVVLPEEADRAQDRLSVLDPMGAALIGLSTGQEIEWDFPDGRHRLRVEGVLAPQLER